MINYDKQNRRIQALERQRDDARQQATQFNEELKRLNSILDGIMHETRRINSEIAAACEDISKGIEKNDLRLASLNAENAFYASGLISSRLTFANFEINPKAAARQTKYSAGVYKKFDKASRALARSAKRKSVRIIINGPSRNQIDVIPAFEMVPFVILENAVKYSPESQEIAVDVADNPSRGCRVQVRVASVGPAVSPDELPALLTRGGRGTEARKMDVPGEGIGLYLADTLTRLAGGRIEIQSSPEVLYKFNDVPHSQFVVTLSFS